MKAATTSIGYTWDFNQPILDSNNNYVGCINAVVASLRIQNWLIPFNTSGTVSYVIETNTRYYGTAGDYVLAGQYYGSSLGNDVEPISKDKLAINCTNPLIKLSGQYINKNKLTKAGTYYDTANKIAFTMLPITYKFGMDKLEWTLVVSEYFDHPAPAPAPAPAPTPAPTPAPPPAPTMQTRSNIGYATMLGVSKSVELSLNVLGQVANDLKTLSTYDTYLSTPELVETNPNITGITQQVYWGIMKNSALEQVYSGYESKKFLIYTDPSGSGTKTSYTTGYKKDSSSPRYTYNANIDSGLYYGAPVSTDNTYDVILLYLIIYSYMILL